MSKYDIDIWLERETTRLDRRYMKDESLTPGDYDKALKEIDTEYYRKIELLYLEELSAPPVTQFRSI